MNIQLKKLPSGLGVSHDEPVQVLNSRGELISQMGQTFHRIDKLKEYMHKHFNIDFNSKMHADLDKIGFLTLSLAVGHAKAVVRA